MHTVLSKFDYLQNSIETSQSNQIVFSVVSTWCGAIEEEKKLIYLIHSRIFVKPLIFIWYERILSELSWWRYEWKRELRYEKQDQSENFKSACNLLICYLFSVQCRSKRQFYPAFPCEYFMTTHDIEFSGPTQWIYCPYILCIPSTTTAAAVVHWIKNEVRERERLR